MDSQRAIWISEGRSFGYPPPQHLPVKLILFVRQNKRVFEGNSMVDASEGQGAPTRGRPLKPAEEARSRRTVTFLTEEEYRQLVDIARRNDISVSAAAHKLLVQSIKTWES